MKLKTTVTFKSDGYLSTRWWLSIQEMKVGNGATEIHLKFYILGPNLDFSHIQSKRRNNYSIILICFNLNFIS